MEAGGALVVAAPAAAAAAEKTTPDKTNVRETLIQREVRP